MERFQFYARAGHLLDTVQAATVAKDNGAKTVRVCHALMIGADGRKWLGYNQPKTVSFTCDRPTAKAIRRAYGEALVFIETKPGLVFLKD